MRHERRSLEGVGKSPRFSPSLGSGVMASPPPGAKRAQEPRSEDDVQPRLGLLHALHPVGYRHALRFIAKVRPEDRS